MDVGEVWMQKGRCYGVVENGVGEGGEDEDAGVL